MFRAMTKSQRDKADREAFARALVLADLSQSDLGARLGMTRQAITNWRGVVPEKCVLRVSIVLGVPADSLRPGLVDETRESLKKFKSA